jgi:hypothetical protein
VDLAGHDFLGIVQRFAGEALVQPEELRIGLPARVGSRHIGWVIRVKRRGRGQPAPDVWIDCGWATLPSSGPGSSQPLAAGRGDDFGRSVAAAYLGPVVIVAEKAAAGIALIDGRVALPDERVALAQEHPISVLPVAAVAIEHVPLIQQRLQLLEGVPALHQNTRHQMGSLTRRGRSQGPGPHRERLTAVVLAGNIEGMEGPAQLRLPSLEDILLHQQACPLSLLRYGQATHRADCQRHVAPTRALVDQTGPTYQVTLPGDPLPGGHNVAVDLLKVSPAARLDIVLARDGGLITGASRTRTRRGVASRLAASVQQQRTPVRLHADHGMAPGKAINQPHRRRRCRRQPPSRSRTARPFYRPPCP